LNKGSKINWKGFGRKQSRPNGGTTPIIKPSYIDEVKKGGAGLPLLHTASCHGA
jgi:hypothetical protein